jgi:hypothetical protein
MTQQTLSTVALESFENAAQAATTAIGAYRAGWHRVIKAVSKDMATRGARRVEPYLPRLASAMRQGSAQGGELAVKGIDAMCDCTQRLFAGTSAGVASQVRRASKLASGIESRWLTSGLATASRISMPGAEAALAVSRRMAGGASKLSQRARGGPARSVKAAVAKVHPAATRAPKVARNSARMSARKSARSAAIEPIPQPAVQAPVKVRKAPVRRAKAAAPVEVTA